MLKFQRIAAALLVATWFASASTAVGQSIYQPGFREVLRAPAFSARSVEVNRSVWTWAADDNDNADEKTDYVHIRISEYGERSGLLSDAVGNTVLSDYDTRTSLRVRQTASAEVYLGARLIDRGNRLRISSDRKPWTGDQQWDETLDSIMVGPQLGMSSFFRYGNWQISNSLAGVLAYHDGYVNQRALLGEDQLPSYVEYPAALQPHVIDLSQSAQLLSYSAEWRLAASYWFGERTRLRLAWTNTYLSNVWKSSARNPVIYVSGVPIASQGRTDDGDFWLDSLQLSLIVTR